VAVMQGVLIEKRDDETCQVWSELIKT